MAVQRGWWNLTSTVELTEADREHIAGLIREGYTEGEVPAGDPCEAGPDVRELVHRLELYVDQDGAWMAEVTGPLGIDTWRLSAKGAPGSTLVVGKSTAEAAIRERAWQTIGEWEDQPRPDPRNNPNRAVITIVPAEPALVLYHRTDTASAERIVSEGAFVSRELNASVPMVFFSNRRDGQVSGYGAAVVTVVLPAAVARLDDEFPDGELHYSVPANKIEAHHIVKPIATS